jgi:hypothetical protein
VRPRPPDGATFDLFEGMARGAEGMKRVKENNHELMVKILILIRELPTGWIGQMENIRAMSEPRYGKPTHPNFYGSVTREAVKLGILEYTGRMVKMRRVKSHARQTPELTRPL